MTTDDLIRHAIGTLVRAHREASVSLGSIMNLDTAEELLSIGELLANKGACVHGVILGPCALCGTNNNATSMERDDG